MESYKEVAIKMEDPIMSYFDNNNNFTGLISDYYSIDQGKNSLGFMELLGVQDFCSVSSVFDVNNNTTLELPKEEKYQETVVEEEGRQTTHGVLLNTPTTPNCSSISSETNDGQTQTEDAAEGEVAAEEQTKSKQQLKVKKTASQKKQQKEPRFAFMTKSEVDFLEDGYRWRKYGQKAVKNSPFPRNYYRCTSASCNVKKRVERCFNDPTIVVTTYEGKHTHPSPMNNMMTRGPSCYPARVPSQTAFPLPMQFNNMAHQSSLHPHFNDLTSNPLALNPDLVAQHGRHFCTPSSSPLMGDHQQAGLLQDLMPPR